MTKPLDFIGIGASKSGTTALFRYLRTDPDLFLPADKDAPFFAVDHYYRAGWERFAKNFFATAPPGTLWGTVTPRYMEDPTVPERIAATMPDVRLIALLRNPIDRAYSQYRQQVRRGKETKSFAARIEEVIEGAGREDTEERILAPGHYDRILETYLRHFPRRQLLVALNETLAADPQEVIDRVRCHLGLPPDFVPPNLGRKYHVGGQQRFPTLLPVLRRIGPLRSLWRLLPRHRRAGIWTWFFTEANVVEENAAALDPALRLRLANYYQESVDRLRILIGQPVPWEDFLDTADAQR